MDLWCLKCMRRGKWQAADTLRDGNAVCLQHALEDSGLTVDDEASMASLLSGSRPRQR